MNVQYKFHWVGTFNVFNMFSKQHFFSQTLCSKVPGGNLKLFMSHSCLYSRSTEPRHLFAYSSFTTCIVGKIFWRTAVRIRDDTSLKASVWASMSLFWTTFLVCNRTLLQLILLAYNKKKIPTLLTVMLSINFSTTGTFWLVFLDLILLYKHLHKTGGSTYLNTVSCIAKYRVFSPYLRALDVTVYTEIVSC